MDKKADFPGPDRFETVGLGIGSKGYVGTGTLYNSGYTRLNDFWEFDPAADPWAQKANLNGEGRWEASGFTLNGKGYLVAAQTAMEEIFAIYSIMIRRLTPGHR